MFGKISLLVFEGRAETKVTSQGLTSGTGRGLGRRRRKKKKKKREPPRSDLRVDYCCVRFK